MVHSAEAAWKTRKDQQECRQPLSSSELLKSGFESWQPAGLQAKVSSQKTTPCACVHIPVQSNAVSVTQLSAFGEGQEWV